MTKTTRVLLAATCCILVASVMVAVIAVMFHPTKSVTANLIKELQQELRCAICRENEDDSSPECEKCLNTRNKVENGGVEDCELTDDIRTQLTQFVDSKNYETRKRQVKIIKNAANLSPNKSKQFIEQMSNLNLNVPRPSAHWYLHNSSTRPPCRDTGRCSAMRDIPSWEWRNETKVAHSQNGISHDDGHMKFSTSGWYHVYFQIDFRSHVEDLSSYNVSVLVPSDHKAVEVNYLMTAKEVTECGHRKRNRRDVSHPNMHVHSCVVLSGSGTFKLLKGDKIRVEIKMPKDASLDTQKSHSYLGALYLRHA